MAGDRSPNYPIISLADAIGRVQVIYDKERQHAADKLVIAKDLGYGSLNGLSRSIISALVKFGLLTEEQDQLKVSLDALDIVLHSAGQPERIAAIQRAAYLPPLFSELRATFDGSLPSDENLRAYLVKKGFNPNTVSNVIKSYRDTVLYANQEAAQGAIPEEAAVKTPGPITFVPSVAPVAGLELAFNLAPGCQARITFTGAVDQAAIRKLQAYLDLSLDTFPDGVILLEALEI
jgi:hypothetical protein